MWGVAKRVQNLNRKLFQRRGIGKNRNVLTLASFQPDDFEISLKIDLEQGKYSFLGIFGRFVAVYVNFCVVLKFVSCQGNFGRGDVEKKMIKEKK